MSPPLKPHGTMAAYRRHLRYGQTPCRACTDGVAAYERQRRRQLDDLGRIIALLAEAFETAS